VGQLIQVVYLAQEPSTEYASGGIVGSSHNEKQPLDARLKMQNAKWKYTGHSSGFTGGAPGLVSTAR